jgi:hypothetical protein
VFFAIRHACARAGGSSTSRDRRDGAADASTAIYSASKAAIEQRLTVLEVAEQALEGHPDRSTQRVF